MEADYEPLNEGYSHLLRELVSKCIEPDPALRPNALGVIKIMAEKIILRIDSQTIAIKQLRKRVEGLPRNSRIDLQGQYFKMYSILRICE